MKVSSSVRHDSRRKGLRAHEDSDEGSTGILVDGSCAAGTICGDVFKTLMTCHRNHRLVNPYGEGPDEKRKTCERMQGPVQGETEGLNKMRLSYLS